MVSLATTSVTSYGGGLLPTVSDPDATYAAITKREYEDFISKYSDFEEDLIEKATTDTSLIDQARLDAPMAAQLTQGIQERNISRYGGELTGAQANEMSRALERGSVLGGIQSVNDARIAQDEANTRLLSDLINIGQGVNRASQSQLGTSAQNATQLKNAYQQAKAQSKAQTYNTVGQLGTGTRLTMLKPCLIKYSGVPVSFRQFSLRCSSNPLETGSRVLPSCVIHMILCTIVPVGGSKSYS